jgi:arylsulfatase A-like enzyme
VHAGRDFIHRDEITIADVLKEAGYTTGAFGKWHSGKTWSYFSWNRGFDVGVHSKLYRYFDTQVIYNNKVVNVEGPITDVIGDQVVRFIEENKDNPFFAYVPFQSIHEPYNCPADVFQKYKAQGYTDHVARLYGMIEVLDNNVGKILNTVNQLGIAENTVIMFLNDDGPSPGFDLSYGNRRMNDEEKAERKRGWAKEYRGGKGSIWQGGSLTPFYIQWKDKVKPGMEFHQLSGVIDLFPTILDICGIQYDDPELPIHGQSIWPILTGNAPDDWQERRYFDNTNFYLIPRRNINMDEPQMHHIALHYKDYKLIRGNNALYRGADSVYYQLYDLENDPMETKNILEEDVEIAAQLIPEIEGWYSNILKNGRAFHQAVYEIGNWEETSTPINLDAVLDVKGALAQSKKTSFRVDNWTSVGSGMSFEIDVVEKGAYLVELGYACDVASFGSSYSIYTQFDTAQLIIQHPNTAISDTLFLPEGRQVLNIDLIAMGRGSVGVDIMSRLIVHRVPESKDSGILRNAGMLFKTNTGEEQFYYVSSATADFLFGGKSPEPLEIESGESLIIQPYADNEEQIEMVTLYLGFDKIDTKKKPPFSFSINPAQQGKYTINVELMSKSGTITVVHGDIVVFSE